MLMCTRFEGMGGLSFEFESLREGPLLAEMELSLNEAPWQVRWNYVSDRLHEKLDGVMY